MTSVFFSARKYVPIDLTHKRDAQAASEGEILRIATLTLSVSATTRLSPPQHSLSGCQHLIMFLGASAFSCHARRVQACAEG